VCTNITFGIKNTLAYLTELLVVVVVARPSVMDLEESFQIQKAVATVLDKTVAESR
jgi:hypothetical protein